MLKDAKWITMKYPQKKRTEEYNNDDSSVLFRKEFVVEKNPSKVTLFICALGIGECFINGENVTEDVLTTPYTIYDKKVIYQTYDVTHLVKMGDNAIGVHVGNGMYNDNLPTWKDSVAPWKHSPKLIAKIVITYSDMTDEEIVTNSKWKVNYGPCIYNHARQGEVYDANLKSDGFDKAGFDDSLWDEATLTAAPGGKLSDEKTVPIRVVETIEPICFKDGFYDFGKNYSGRIRVRLKGEKGQKVVFSYLERTFEPDPQTSNNMYLEKYNMPIVNKNIFICSGKEEEYYPAFEYYGFRYVKVENAPEIMDIKAEFICSDLKVVGTFTTSDEILQKIHNASVQATRSNFVGIPTDCPHREQNGWTGDALCSCDQSLMNFDMTLAYRKWLGDFKDVQRPSGQLPGIIPSAGWGYVWGSGPAWDSSLILIPYKTYLHTSDTEIIEYMWDTMEKYMDFIVSMSEDYLVNFGLGDWCHPRPEHMIPTIITDTAFFYADSVAMMKMAKVTGRDCEKWEKLSENIRDAWRKNFLDREEHKKYQTFYAMGIYYELFSEDERFEYAKKLSELVKENDYHIDTGILGAYVIFSALSEYGYADVLYKMVTNPTCPSYAYWVNSGMTTLCERWDMSYSQNHHMYSEVDNWFYRYLGGIKYTDEGLLISPCYLEEVEKVSVCHKGIAVERNEREVKVTLPVSARVKIGDFDGMVEPGEYTYTI